MNNVFILLIVIGLTSASEESAKISSVDQAQIDKAVDGGCLDSIKAYDAYQMTLKKSQEKVLNALEKLKQEAMKKGNLPLANGADAKAKEVKENGLAEYIADRRKVDLLGEEQEKVWYIKADKVTERNPNARFGETYPEMLWTSGPTNAYYEISVRLSPGKYYVYALLASGDQRPCRVLVNKKEVGNGFGIVTGGFQLSNVQSDKIGPFNVDGPSVIRVEANANSPHFYGFAISDKKDLVLKVSDFAKGVKQ